jgi:hypothetical protein
MPLLPEYSPLVGGVPGSRCFQAVAQREHEDGDKASRQRTIYGQVWYDHGES